jgi:hypothetical protein
MNIRGMVAVFLVLGIASAPAHAQEPAPAQESEQLEKLHQSIINLINLLAQKGVLTKDAADQLMHEAEQSATAKAPAQNAVPVPDEFAQNVVITTDESDESVMSAKKEVPAPSVTPAAAASPQSATPAAVASVPSSPAPAPSATPVAQASASSGDPASEASPQNVAPSEQQVKPGVVRVPYVPEVVRREIKEEIKQEVLAQAKGERWGDPGAMPDWLSRISWDGDFRLRYQRDGFPAGNTLPASYNPIGLTLIGNTTDTQNYMQIQARLGMKAVVSDNTFASFRFSTGTASNAASDNQTLGNGFNKDTLLLDRAYVQSAPYNWMTLSGGRMPNPWLSTDLLWDPTVNFDGVAAQLRPRIIPEISPNWNVFLAAGAFPYQHIQQSDMVLANSKWLYGAQLGTQWTAMDSSSAQLGVALYDFRNVEGIPNATQGSHFYDDTAAQSMQKGNSLMYVNALGDPTLYGLASKFRELDLTAKMDWATFDPVHVMLTGDYVRNLGFDATEILARTGQSIVPEITGYEAALVVGNPRIKQHGDWQVSVAYKYIERDAVLDALTDSLFHLGGTNAKGYILGGNYGLDKGTSLGLRWISSDQIDGPPLSIDSLIVDLNVRF